MSKELSHTLIQVRSDKPILLPNETCVYCGKDLALLESTKEHVIGRRFVPRGKLDNQWNLIVRACKPCNVQKSDLEDDISAITMLPSAAGQHVVDDALLAKDARRKAQSSISRKTKKKVQHSSESLTLKVPFGPDTFTFNVVAPPQIDSKRIYELCRMQLTGFFYWITFNGESGKGGYWLGEFCPLLETARSDWGHPINVAFMDAVATWEPRILGIGADTFFKVVIRRHPSKELWSWALEWNQNYRVIGFFGDRDAAQSLVDTFPQVALHEIQVASHELLRSRTEMPLDEERDRLFFWSGKVQAQQSTSAPHNVPHIS